MKHGHPHRQRFQRFNEVSHPRDHRSHPVNQRTSDITAPLTMVEINLEFLQSLLKEDYPDLTLTEFEVRKHYESKVVSDEIKLQLRIT